MIFTVRQAVSLTLVSTLFLSACSAPSKGRPEELSQEAKDLLSEAEKDLFLYRFEAAMQKTDQVLAMHPDSREALKMIFKARLAQLNNDAFIAERQREESQAKATRDALRSATLPDEKPALDRALIQYRAGLTEVDQAAIQEKLERKVAQMDLLNADLDAVLYKIFQEAEINIALDPGNFSGKKFTIRGKDMTVRYLLENIARTQGLSFTVDNENVWIVSSDNPIFIKREYRLNTGLTRSDTKGGYEGLGTIGFLGQTTKAGQGGGALSGGGASSGSSGASKDKEKSHIELFIEKIPDLLPDWPKGSEIYLDKKQNVLIVRSTREAIAEIEKSLKILDEIPRQILVKARFVQITGEENFDFGVSWDFTALSSSAGTIPDYTLDGPSGNYFGGTDPAIVNADVDANKNADLVGTGTSFNSAFDSTLQSKLGTSEINFKGVFRDRPFQAVLSAIQRTSFANTVSEPSAMVTNNGTATIGVTRNYPYVEDYQVESVQLGQNFTGGIVNTTNAPVVTATINDQNFEGRALVVTPSIGADGKTITLYLQPVVRSKVSDLSISNPVSGLDVDIPSVTRPIFETKYVTTQVSVTDGDTVVIGGLITDEEILDEKKVPLLGDLPLIGALFQRKQTIHNKVNLYIFITVNIISPQGSTYR